MGTHTVVGPKVLNALLAAREFMGFCVKRGRPWASNRRAGRDHYNSSG